MPSVVAVVVDSVVVDFVDDDVAFFLVAGFSVVFANSFLIICSVALIGFGLSVVFVVDEEDAEEEFDASAFLFGRGPARNS